MADFDLYTQKTIKKIRAAATIKRNFLTERFFPGYELSPTEEIMLEITRGGERVAPFVTPLEAGRAIVDKKVQTNLIVAPNIGVTYPLQPRDFFTREAGQLLDAGFNIGVATGKRIGQILEDQENYITNKEELMVAQFLTEGKVESVADDAGYEVDYQLVNKETLSPGSKWGEEGVNPLASLDELLENAEQTGTLVDTVVMGSKAAKLFLNSSESQKMLSKDTQSEFVKEVVRKYPGVVWIGTYLTYGVEIFRYSRKVMLADKTKVSLIPENMIVGGPTQGKIMYAPIINLGNGNGDAGVHMARRYSSTYNPSPKIKEISTEARPVLQPQDISAYFSVVVCDK